MKSFTSLFSQKDWKSYFLSKNRVRESFDAPVCEDVDVALGLLKPRHMATLNSLLAFFNVYTSVTPSQTTLGRLAKRNRATVNAALDDLESLGLISKKYLHYDTCEYKVDAHFRDLEFRKKWSHLFRSFIALPISILMVPLGTPPNLRTTQYNINNYSSLSYISTPDHYLSSPELDISVRAHVGVGRRGLRSEKIKDRRVMEQKTPIRDSITSLNQLNLTIYGQIRLSVFPDQALEYGIKKLKYATYAKDKFALFWATCRDYCKNNNLELDWEGQDKLKDEYGYPDGCSMVLVQKGQPSAEQRKAPQREQGSKITKEEFYAKKQAQAEAENAKRIAQGKQSAPIPFYGDPFKLPQEQRLSFFRAIDPTILKYLLKLGLSSPRSDREMKLEILSIATTLGVGIDSLVSQQDLDRIISPDILMESRPDSSF